MNIHALKTWPDSFDAVIDGRKTCEIRSTVDRTFRVGDLLALIEWRDGYGATGRTALRQVKHVLELGAWIDGAEGFVALSIGLL